MRCGPADDPGHEERQPQRGAGEPNRDQNGELIEKHQMRDREQDGAMLAGNYYPIETLLSVSEWRGTETWFELFNGD